MKQLLSGVVLIIVVGLGAFFYRNVTERPGVATPAGGECTLEAKMCPDGSSVGRSGAACTFAPCAYPNVEIAGAAFAVPPGYVADENAIGANPELLAAFIKPATGVNHTLIVYQYPVTEGKTAETVMVERTRFSPSDMLAEGMDDFTQVNIDGKVFYSAVIERFEGMVQTAYYLPYGSTVLRFDVIEHDVNNWTDATLVISDLPEHKALRQMLGTLQLTQP